MTVACGSSVAACNKAAGLRQETDVKRIVRTDGPFGLIRRLDAHARSTNSSMHDGTSLSAVPRSYYGLTTTRNGAPVISRRK